MVGSAGGEGLGSVLLGTLGDLPAGITIVSSGLRKGRGVLTRVTVGTCMLS